MAEKLKRALKRQGESCRSPPAGGPFYMTALCSDQPDVAPLGAENMFDLRGIEAVHARQQAAEHGAVFVEHRVVAVLEQRGLLQPYLLAAHLAALDASAQHPVD